MRARQGEAFGPTGVSLRRYAGWLAVLALLVLWASDLPRLWRITNHHDLEVFLLAAQRLLTGQDIYADAAPFRAAIESGAFNMRDAFVVWPYAYAPLIALLFVPATALPVPLVQAAWWVMNLGALLLGSWLSLSALGRPTAWQIALALLALHRFDPAIVALRLGQIELLQFLLLAAALYAWSREREALGGAFLGLAAGLKFFPLALVGLLIWRRRWLAAAWAMGIALLAIGGSFVMLGRSAVTSFMALSGMYGIGGAFAAFPLNQSLNGFVSRNLIDNIFVASLKGWHLPGLAKALILAADMVVVAISALVTWRRVGWAGARDHQVFALQYGLGIMALLLVSPHSQVYTYVWVLVPLMVVIALSARAGIGARFTWGALLVAYLLMGRAYAVFVPGITRFVQAHYMWGALLLWGLLAWVLGALEQSLVGKLASGDRGGV
jgi:hypothetical protein